MLIDQGIQTAGGLAVALNEQVALAVIQREPQLERAGTGLGLRRSNGRPSPARSRRNRLLPRLRSPDVVEPIVIGTALFMTDAGSTRGALAGGISRAPGEQDPVFEPHHAQGPGTTSPASVSPPAWAVDRSESDRPAEKHGRSPSVADSSRTISRSLLTRSELLVGDDQIFKLDPAADRFQCRVGLDGLPPEGRAFLGGSRSNACGSIARRCLGI